MMVSQDQGRQQFRLEKVLLLPENDLIAIGAFQVMVAGSHHRQKES